VAIVGSGPGGFFAAEALLRAGRPVQIDMLDRLPTPFGLVRGGVAPDHPKIKSIATVFDRIARTPAFRFLGNVTVGIDVSVQELREHYDAVILACGSTIDARLDIPGEDLPGSHAATEFVGWYNGQPGCSDRFFDLKQEVAVIIGQGNVAADVARILATPVDELARTDIARHALEVLAESSVREIHIVGRRGPVQSKLSTNELRELGEIPNCNAVTDARDFVLDPVSQHELDSAAGHSARRNLDILRGFSAIRAKVRPKRIIISFFESPVAIAGAGRVEAVRLERNRLVGEPFGQSAVPTGQMRELACGLVFRSIGYRGVPLPGVPFDCVRGLFPNLAGRILAGDSVVHGLYAAGWSKRGPSGIIGTNRADSIETVAAVLEDLAMRSPRPGRRDLCETLAARGIRITSYADWLRIDAAEVARVEAPKPREKFVRIAEMLRALD
jgi:ferredoxin--NADP+ reductase